MIDIRQFYASNIYSSIKDHFPLGTGQNLNSQSLKYLLVFVTVWLILMMTTYIYRLWLSITRKYAFLELAPNAKTQQETYSTEQLFTLIHDLGKQRKLMDRLIGYKKIYSFEVVSTKEEGIRFIIRINSDEVDSFKHHLLAYLPDIQIKVTEDYLHKNRISSYFSCMEFTLSHSPQFPLKRQQLLSVHDPIAFLIGNMTQLQDNELIAFQLLLSPLSDRKQKNKKSKFINVMGRKFNISPKTVSIANDLERAIFDAAHSKMSQPLFYGSIRLLVRLNNKSTLTSRKTALASSFSVFSLSGVQSLVVKHAVFKRFWTYYTGLKLKYRLLSLTNIPLLSISEVSDIYHLPYLNSTKTEDLVTIISKTLPAPLSFKQATGFDVSFAQNTYGGATTMIGLTQEERKRHMYVIGATGSGKTTMLLSMIEQDVKHGKGICVVDPHGDLAETIIDCVPTERINDLIYFNPYDIKYPIGVNLLELTPDLDEDEALIEKEFIAESVISLFRKMFSDGGSGHPHRIEYILRNTIHTAFTVENATLFTIFELLNNPAFQKKVVQKLKDENLQNFWKYEFGKAGDYQQVKMTAPVTSRIGRFLFSPSAKRILEQEKSTINFDDILDTNKILICNLSKGNIGEDTSEVMGIMILNKIQLAALKRARRGQKDRNPFYLYVDEFQNFATPSFVQMLSESRKYGLNLTIAEQSTSQQNDRNLTHVILANVGTVVGFRSANPIDEDLLLRQFSPRVDKGDVANLPAYHFYMKTSALKPEEAFSGETIPLDILIDIDKQKNLIQATRSNFAIEYKQKHITRPTQKEKLDKKGIKITAEIDPTVNAFPEI